jgi:hypothetical protein
MEEKTKVEYWLFDTASSTAYFSLGQQRVYLALVSAANEQSNTTKCPQEP